MEGADFVVKTEGHCFLCRSQIISVTKSDTSLSSTSTHSLQYLARYLNLDMRKVFSEEALVPQRLLEKLEKSILKVELCGDCTTLYKTFSKLYRQLEKSQMEVTSCLNLIHGKLASPAADKRRNNYITDFRVGLMTKMEIAEALRTEAMEKCSRKLLAVSPQIKTRKLNMQQVNKEKLRIRIKAQSKTVQSFTFKNEPGAEFREVNEEHSLLADDDDNTNVDININGDRDQMDYSDAPVDDLDSAECNLDATLKVESCPSVPNESAPRKRVKASNVEECTKAILPPPIKNVTGRDGYQYQYSKDPKTGKYKCQLCPNEYTAQTGVQSHYSVSHLGGKFKCPVCSQGFGQMSHYNAHYLNVHMDVRFKCDKCDRLFTRKYYLMQHLKAYHLNKPIGYV